MSESTQANLRALAIPLAVGMVGAIILAPSFFVSAAQGDGDREGCKGKQHRHAPLAQVVEIDTAANTMLLQHVAPEDAPDDIEDRYVFVTYDDDTVFKVDKEDATESDIEAGDTVAIRGEVNRDSEDYFAEIDAEVIASWDELEPKRPHRGKHAHRSGEEA